jgi:hypothetical protein
MTLLLLNPPQSSVSAAHVCRANGGLLLEDVVMLIDYTHS